MPFLLPLPAIRPLLDGDGEAYDLVEPLRWTEPDGTGGEVEPPFRTDLASVPRPARALVPTSGRHTVAAMRHDRRCDDLNTWHTLGRPDDLLPHLTSIEADAEFLDGVRELDPSHPLRALVLWAGVRWGALVNPARRDGWTTTVLAVVLVSLLIAPLYLPVALINAAAQAVDAGANALACCLRTRLADPPDPTLVPLDDLLPERSPAP